MAVIWCVTSIALAAIALIFLFRLHVITQIEEELSSHVVQLVALTEPDGEGSYQLRGQMADPRYNRPASSWVWQIQRDGEVLLQSESLGPPALGEAIAAPVGTVSDFQGPLGTSLTGLARQIRPRFSQERLTFVVARPSHQVRSALAQFRNIVLGVLVLFGAGQIASATWLVWTGLRPLADLRLWVARMRRGEGQPSEIAWPREIRPVADEIEELENHVDRLVHRARGEAANLAHAIKTPLSVLRQISETIEGPDAELLCRQNDRIDAALARHLASVGTSGRGKRQIDVGAVVKDLKLALEKTLELKGVTLRLDLADDTVVTCDENDLYEIVGNLMDNASKWAVTEIVVATSFSDGQVFIAVEDDGPGIKPEDVVSITKRGYRTDLQQPGHGLGLSIVNELVALYSGTLRVERSTKGGARLAVSFPVSGAKD
ncbi:MAG: HAMP domain-containing sensor histidine kinase [Pseudomonadota bacterium]